MMSPRCCEPALTPSELLLGNGMYNVRGGRYAKFIGSFGAPKAIGQLRLEYVDGTRGLRGHGREMARSSRPHHVLLRLWR